MTNSKNIRKSKIFSIAFLAFMLLLLLPCCIPTSLPSNDPEVRSWEMTLQWKVDFGFNFALKPPVFALDPPFIEIFNLYLYKQINNKWQRWLRLENILHASSQYSGITPSVSNLIWSNDKYLFVNGCVGYTNKIYTPEQLSKNLLVKIYKIDLLKNKIVQTGKFHYFRADASAEANCFINSMSKNEFNLIYFSEHYINLIIIPEDLSNKIKCYNVLYKSSLAVESSYKANMIDNDTIKIIWVDFNNQNKERAIKISDLKEENCAVE